MKEEQAAPERIIVIDIKLNRGLVAGLAIVLVVAALLTFLTLTGASASAAETEAAQATSLGMRQFFLTKSTYAKGDAVLDVCAAGYHTASLWELADPSNLEYNTALGLNGDDGGQGPPSHNFGWVRTGYGSDVTAVAGRANCAVWSSVDFSEYGTVVELPFSWTAGAEDIGVWVADTVACGENRRVWCIED